MKVQLGSIYATKDGKRKFYIIARKTVVKDKFIYVGEETRSGLITYFSSFGEHSHQENFNLELDQYDYIPVFKTGIKSHTFLRWEEIEMLDLKDCVGYLARYDKRMESVCFSPERVVY